MKKNNLHEIELDQYPSCQCCGKEVREVWPEWVNSIILCIRCDEGTDEEGGLCQCGKCSGHCICGKNRRERFPAENETEIEVGVN